MSQIKYYAGIGSRATPKDVQTQMAELAVDLALAGWHLRSGGAEGADAAFEEGCRAFHGTMTIYLPWNNFNRRRADERVYVVPEFTEELERLARRHHPAWYNCSEGARKCLMRNGCQVLGDDLKTPAKMVVCWTKDGKGEGGTGQAIRVAAASGIPVFDLAVCTVDDVRAFVKEV